MKNIIRFEDFTNEEISHTVLKSALGKTREYDQYTRGYKIGQNFYREFVGKSLFGGTIVEIGTANHRSGDFNVIITIEKERNDEYPVGGVPKAPKKISIYYDVARDSFDDTLPGDPSRVDARILYKIAEKVNPETKYKEINKMFKIKEY